MRMVQSWVEPRPQGGGAARVMDPFDSLHCIEERYIPWRIVSNNASMNLHIDSMKVASTGLQGWIPARVGGGTKGSY